MVVKHDLIPERGAARNRPLLAVGFGLLALSIAAIAATVAFAAMTSVDEGETASAGGSVHNVSLNYMYETEPHQASGSNDLKCKSIHFYTNYVVVEDMSGGGQLLAVDRLRRFHYHPLQEDR